MARLPAVVAVLRGLTVLVVWLTNENRGSLDDRDSRVDFTRHLAWLLVVLPALALVGRYRMRAARRDALARRLRRARRRLQLPERIDGG